MRSAILLLASSSCAHAAWLRWSANSEVVWPAQETGHVTKSNQIGWTPIPTPAPGVRKDGEVVLDLLKRQTSKTDWTNSETCGWFSGISSSAILCGNGFTCATNSDHAVACASGTILPFFTACLDYAAFKAGSCDNLDAATGCCQQETEPACGTYLWTGSPQRFMYKCFERASIISVLDVPQFVVDASLFSKTHTTPTPTTTPSKSATGSKSDSASPTDKTGGSNPGSGAGDPASGSTTVTPVPGSSDSVSSNGPNNTAIIVGSVIGGIAGLLALLLILLCCLRRKTKGKLGLGFTRNKKNKKEENLNKAYHTTNVAAAATKGRHSSGSETTTAVPKPGQQQREYHYHNQQQQHYYPQAQAQVQPQFQQPQYSGPTGGQQPVSMSYTVNDSTTLVSQPSSGAPPNFVVGGILPIPYNSNEKQQQQQQQQQQPPPQAQPYFQPPASAAQSQPQYQQPGMASQVQPVNHIHVYYAPPAQPAEPVVSSSSSQFSGTATDAQNMRGIVPDALGLFTPQGQAGGPVQACNEDPKTQRSREREQEQERERKRERERDDIPAYYGHSRDVSALSSTSRRNRSPSPDVDAEWLAARGPGYRQSL